ncbi:MAG: hypothetical protein V1793_01200 [Pseudomonadota bacterium]
MDDTPITREINSRTLRMKLIDGSLISGQVNIKRAPGFERVSDMVTESSDRFLVLFSVTVRHEDNVQPTQYNTLFINRDHILWAAPDEDQ